MQIERNVSSLASHNVAFAFSTRRPSASVTFWPLEDHNVAFGHRRLSERGRWMAAVLACGPRSLLGHRSGAALASIRRASHSRVEVTCPTRRRAVGGIQPDCCTWLQPQDRWVVDAIPCAKPALILLQLAAVVSRRELERACDEAEVQRLFDLKAIEELLNRAGACRGSARLRACSQSTRSARC